MPFVRIPVLALAGALFAPSLLAQAPFGDKESAVDEEAAGDIAEEQAIRVRPRFAITPGEAEDAAPTAEALVRRADQVLKVAVQSKRALGEAAQERDKADAALRLVPEDLHLAKVYLVGRTQVRYLVVRVWLVNVTDAPITVTRESLRLLTRGNELKPGNVPSQPGLRISAGRQVFDPEELSKTGPVTIVPDKPIALPVVFFDLPGRADVPAMTLRLPVRDENAEVDLNDYALGMMKLTIERLGPQGLLGLVTVGGEITPVGAGELVKVLEALVNEKTVRVVLAWTNDAPPVQPDLANWLIQSATRVGGAPVNDGQRPTMPGGLRELHLAAVPKGTGVPNYQGPRRVHGSVKSAVDAALEGAYGTLPLDDLVREIESGVPLTRPAAIAAGGRLPEENLPLLIQLSDDPDVEIARAAVTALRGFGSAAAIDRLVELAQAGPPPVRTAAVESLASSRFGAAHEALRRLLDASATGPLVIPPDTLVSVLARYPRPLWSDALYRLAGNGEPIVRAEALEALSRLGHPDLLALFEAALGETDDGLRGRAFALLARRTDAPSEDLALGFALEHIESQLPTREMYPLLQRTKDQRAVPMLLEHLRTDGANRADLIRLLSQIGGLEVRDALEEVYPTLERSMQPHALASLAQMRSPKFYDFAAAALRSNDPALLNTAQQQLQADGGPEAVDLLVQALFESDQSATLSHAATALAGIGTPAARIALRKAARSSDTRAEIAGRAWWSLQAASAGRDSFLAGDSARKREDWAEAAEHFTTAVELDPQFVDAWSGRANAHMQLADYPAARVDYEKTLELDPSDSAAITCLGILRVFEGQIDEGLDYVGDRAEEFKGDDLFAYNTACLYAVASERLQKDEPERAERLRADAVSELARSIELGMTGPDEVAWMRKDPDLESLHGRADYEKVVASAEGPANRKRPAE